MELDEDILVVPYKFTLVGKFVHHRPSMVKVHDNFSHFRFRGDYTIRLIGATHTLIHLEYKDDYTVIFQTHMLH